MVQTKKASEIGLGQATQLCNMPTKRRLEFIAEGLPIIYASAESLLRASQKLDDFSREAEILERHAEEESAKILILVDIVRCPLNKVASRIGPMMKWFYDHLARLIYAKAQNWRPVTAKDLQDYVDSERQSHYLEGGYSEYIMPNWELFRRESSLYADVVGNEDGDPDWISPLHQSTGLPALVPASFRVVDALSAIGAFSIEGIKVLAEVWGTVDVKPDIEWSISRDLNIKLIEKLETLGLITDRVTNDHAATLIHGWQLPMYNIEFSQINVPLEDLRDRRAADLPYDI